MPIIVNWDEYLQNKVRENAYKVSIPDPFVAPGIPTGYEGWTAEQLAAKFGPGMDCRTMFGPEINQEEEMA